MEGLGQHASNLVLQLIIRMAKYPTAMRICAMLPAKVTPGNLKTACHAAILEAADLVQDEVFRQEMLIFDDQRMGPSMGLPRVMEWFGFLRKSTNALPASGRLVRFGHRKPLLEYKLTYDKQVLVKCLRKVHDLKLHLPDRLSNRVAVQYANALSGLATAWPKWRTKETVQNAKTKMNKTKVESKPKALITKKRKLPASGHAKKADCPQKTQLPLKRCLWKGPRRGNAIDLVNKPKRKYI